VPAYVVSLIQLFEPVGATLLAMLVFGMREAPGWNVVLGGIAILAGVWIPIRSRLRSAAPKGI
jgi:drug/metabolite transporter (DMT)-like permease